MLQPQYCGKWTVRYHETRNKSLLEADLLLQALKVLLEEWRKDRTNKVLIFTKSVKLLEMLEFHLNTKGLPFDLLYYLLGVHSCRCSRI
jgi:SNF2 family DNA or RNA helicase